MTLSLREIKSFARINTINQDFLNLSMEEQKIYITNKLKNVDWYKSNKRIEYNTWLYYKNNGYNPELLSITNLELGTTKYYIKLNGVMVIIRIQDFFFIKFMIKFIKKKNIKEWLCDNYLLNDKVLVEFPLMTHKYEKIYRVDYLLHISDNNYLCIEFFENSHKSKDDPDFKKEKNRIYSIIHDSDNRYKKILFFGIYWEDKLNDDVYFKNFVKTIYDKINEYKDIDNEKIWCVNGINKYINNIIISESIYDSHKNKKNTIIDINEINKVIKFKSETSKELHYKDFMDDINELVNYKNDILKIENNELDIDDSDDEIEETNLITDYIKNNKLSLQGLTRYLKVKRIYLLDIIEEETLLNFYTNITQGFVFGLKNQRNALLNLEENRILGIYDY
jgi:hypothetical protein